MQSVLTEKQVQVEFNFSAEFHDQGLLKKLYADFEANKPYLLTKFQNFVLVLNLAMQIV